MPFERKKNRPVGHWKKAEAVPVDFFLRRFFFTFKWHGAKVFGKPL